WRDFPGLVAGALFADGITADVSVAAHTAKFTAAAASRLAAVPESDLPEIQAWRRAFARMGLKPTQYRCAAESLLRRIPQPAARPPSPGATPHASRSPSGWPSPTSPRSPAGWRCGAGPVTRNP